MADGDLERLIRRARQGEPQAYDALIDAYAPRLHGYLYRLTGSRDDADDLLQEVFLRVVRTIATYRHDGRFDAWLFRIATNLVRDRIRRLRRAPRTLSLDGPAPAESEGGTERLDVADTGAPLPDAGLVADENADRVQSALARLPDAEREVIMLRHFSQLSFAQIAGAMGTPLGTALARAHRGLAKMRAWLQPETESVENA